MNIQKFREHCIRKKGVTEEFPFDNKTLVFKVMGKMFALFDVDMFSRVNLKCDPDRSIDLREDYQSITAGFHMNKKHWNTVHVNGDVTDELFLELTDHSYDLVSRGLTKKAREELKKMD